jgi:hypothetical protein
MSNHRTRWVLRTRTFETRTDKVSSVGILLSYPDRECDLNIHIQTPVAGTLPENNFVLAELGGLRSIIF